MGRVNLCGLSRTCGSSEGRGRGHLGTSYKRPKGPSRNLTFNCKQPAPPSFTSAPTERRFRGVSGKVSPFLGLRGGGKCHFPQRALFS